jgi:hypothetical protein
MTKTLALLFAVLCVAPVAFADDAAVPAVTDVAPDAAPADADTTDVAS